MFVKTLSLQMYNIVKMQRILKSLSIIQNEFMIVTS